MAFLAKNPDSGAGIPGCGGRRKVRWSMDGHGKRWRSEGDLHRSTAQPPNGVLIALLIYGKGATENIPAQILRSIAKELNHGPD